MATPRSRRTAAPGNALGQAPGRASGGPPRLDLRIIDRLKLLAFINVLPLIVLAVGIPMYLNGSIKLKENASAGLAPILIMVGACIVLCLSCWMILPIASWLKARPRWHYAHGNKWVWAVPFATGLIAGALLRLLAVLSGIAALLLLGCGLVRLWEAWA